MHGLRPVEDDEHVRRVAGHGVGGPAGVVGWLDDAAIAVSAKDPTPDDPHVKASVYLVARDDAAAAEK